MEAIARPVMDTKLDQLKLQKSPVVCHRSSTKKRGEAKT
jgi:hypothetical protein